MRDCSRILSDFDIIHCHFRHVYRYVSLVNKFFPFKGKVILHDHYGSIDVDKKIPLFFSTFQKPVFYIGVSKSLTNWAKINLSLKDNSVFLLENIIQKKNQKLSLYNSFDFILVSNIKPIKNNQFAVDLVKSLDKSLLIVGQNQDSVYFDELNNSISDKISIKTDLSNAQSVLHLAKFGLHTSISETGPLVLIEYLAHNLPFLAYETGEVAIILKKYFPDFFIDNFDLAKWQNRINEINNKTIDFSLFEEVYEKEFGKESYYQKIINIYLCINQKN
jgi:glycosyltransferase involved in cell wall biosynthesis